MTEKKKKANNNFYSPSDQLEIKRKITEVRDNTVPMVAVLNNVLDGESRKLEEDDSVVGKVIENNNSSLMIKGKKGRVSINDIISQSLGQRYSDITRFNGYGFGTSSFLRQARVNKFIEYNLTMMHTSGSLIVDDILNGSSFGNEEGYEKPFSFYNGSSTEITDENKVKKMMSLLEPDDLDTAISDTKSVSVIAKEAMYIARRDGCCAVRVIPYSSIAKSMYIKWMLKEAKIKQAHSSLESLEDKTEYFVKDEESLLKINGFLNSIGLESLTLNSQLSQYLDLSILNSIPKKLLSERKIKNFSTESISDEYTKREMEHSETFYSFASRYLSGELNRLYSYETEYNLEISNNKETKVKSNPTFSFSYSGLRNADYKDILSKMFSSNTKEFSLESLEENTDNFINNLDDFSKEIINNSSFDEIYNLSIDTAINKINHKGNTNIQFYSTESLNETKKESLDVTLTPLELLVSNMIKEINSEEELYSTESLLDMNTNTNVDLITGSDLNGKSIEKITERAEEKQKTFRKLDRMFDIKGEHVEILDNTNLHFVMAGDRMMGVYQLELSSDDLQNIIMARNMIYSGSLGAGMNYNNVNVDDIDLDQTMGRLMFTDYVKPILEKYMSKELIKNNVEIGYDLMKIMEENDMSNLAKDVSELGSSIYNYTKVNFIPAEEIVFFRNGTRGLGESLFKKAEIPAHMSILLREEYLGWVISDGKGVTFVTVPQGASDVNGEIGMSPLFDQIDEFMSLDRTSLRNTLSTNVSLTRKFFKMVKPDSASADIKIDNIDMPEFPINTELQMLLIQEATEKVGYNSALFSSTDGNIELARKLYEMNGTKVLEIISAQKLFKKVMCQLATLLLRLRGGDEYKDVVAVWNPPLPSKINIDQKLNTVTSKFDLVTKLIEVVDNIFEKDPSIGDYELVRNKLLIKYVKDIFKNDSIFDDIDNTIETIKGEVKVDLATAVKEK